MAVRDLSLKNESGNIFRVLCVFIAVCFSTGFSEEDLGSPLRTAQCRAGCVNKFSVVPLRLTSCLRDAECNMCWENCQLLQSFPAFEAICSKSSVCFSGCQEACRFHDEMIRNPAKSQRVPVMITAGEKVLEICSRTARWPRPRATGPHDSLVYIVMKRTPGHAWKQLEQTLDQSTRVVTFSDAGALRVLAVNRTGLVAIYSPASRPSLKGADIIIKSLGKAGLFPSETNEMTASAKNGGRRINTPISRLSTINPLKLLAGVEETQASSPSLWNLREISLIHQRVLVIAEIAWDARKPTQRPPTHAPTIVYLVTWEIDGGGLKGNLFTNSTCVTLSLWPDTVCHIKVEVYETQPSSKLDQSEELILDTHRVAPVEIDSAPQTGSPSFSSSTVSPHPEELSTPSTLLPFIPQIHRRNHTVQIWAVESDLGDRRVEKVVGPQDSYHELVLGALAAVVLFLVVVTSLAVKNRRMDSVLLMYGGSPKDAESKSKLVHEVHEVQKIQEVHKGPEPSSRSCSQGPVPVVKFFNEYSTWMSSSLPTNLSEPSSSRPNMCHTPASTHLVNTLQRGIKPVISSVNPFTNTNQTKRVDS